MRAKTEEEKTLLAVTQEGFGAPGICLAESILFVRRVVGPTVRRVLGDERVDSARLAALMRIQSWAQEVMKTYHTDDTAVPEEEK